MATQTVSHFIHSAINYIPSFTWHMEAEEISFFAEQGHCVTKQVWIPCVSRKGLENVLPGSILSTRMLPLVSRRKYSVMMPSIFNVIDWFD